MDSLVPGAFDIDPWLIGSAFAALGSLWAFAIAYSPKSLTLTMGLGMFVNGAFALLSFHWLSFPAIGVLWLVSGLLCQLVPLWACMRVNTREEQERQARRRRVHEPSADRDAHRFLRGAPLTGYYAGGGAVVRRGMADQGLESRLGRLNQA